MQYAQSQRQKLMTALDAAPMLRAHELKRDGISPGTIARAVDEGVIVRIGRGLYQHADAAIDADQTLAEASKRIPKGVITLVSALAFHELTDQMPRSVWIAIGTGDWSPVASYPPVRIVRLSEKFLRQGIEYHQIAGVNVPIYSIEKTLADAFRNPKLVDRSVAVEALRAALNRKKVPPAFIAEAAKAGGAWTIMRPYLEALTLDG
jgi:predicted transcriptional regulator of viral defense system